jgi:hypothetical protein
MLLCCRQDQKPGFSVTTIVMKLRHGPTPGGACCTLPLSNQNLNRNIDFIDTMISNVLLDLPFIRNQSLQSAYDSYTGILKNEIKIYKVLDELKKPEDETL